MNMKVASVVVCCLLFAAVITGSPERRNSLSDLEVCGWMGVSVAGWVYGCVGVCGCVAGRLGVCVWVCGCICG